MDEHTISPAGDPFHAAPDEQDQGHPCACNDGWVTIGQIAIDPETGEEAEEYALYLCHRCAEGGVMESRELQGLRDDLHDLYDGVAGLGVDLEALNHSVRALTAHLTGEDPLKHDLYYGEAREGDGPQPPPWINGGFREPDDDRIVTGEEADAVREHLHLRREQRAGAAAGYIVLSAIVGSLATAMLLLYALS